MKRKIIKINEDLCDGCGNCTTGCSEGALQIINGKAKLVKEDFCDGFGDCIGTCPTGALEIVEREAKEFDIDAVKDHLRKTQGEEAVKKMEEAQLKHSKKEHDHGVHFHDGHACPSSIARSLKDESKKSEAIDSDQKDFQAIASDLEQWPVQIHLVSPLAPYFNGKELVIMSTCAPLVSADIHWRFLRGRSVVVGCPKLDNTDPYVEKLANILKHNNIPKIIPVIMEVPCCKGLTEIVKEAVKLSGKNVQIQEHVISLDGKIN
ncbi:MAG: 4Fe-4S dicluster domain-containing protein [Pseudomonadota bacterium]